MEYARLVETYKQLEETQATLEKTSILAELFKGAEEDIEYVVLLALGRVYPDWKEPDIGISSRIMVDIIHQATGRSKKEIEEVWKNKGDLGLAAEQMVENKTQQKLMTKTLTVENVVKRLRKVAEMEKEGLSQSVNMDKKKKEVADLISNSKPEEARYIARIVLNNLRLGVGEGTVRDALAEAFFDGEYQQEIQRAYDFTNDFSQVAEACRNGIEDVRDQEIQLFRPIKSMLARNVDTIEDGFDTVGEPAAIDYKYDGMRAQIHVKEGEVKLFTRRLEDITKQFPEVVDTVEENVQSKNCIIDSEIVAYSPSDKSTIPFQKLSKRIKRKYDIQKLKSEIPVEVRPFDLIYDEESVLEQPYIDRWKKLKELVSEKKWEIRMADHEVTEDPEKVQEMQQKSLSDGHEGIMMKALQEKYKPGSRVGYMVKLKPVMETLDLAIIGAKWSEGRRSGWLGRLYLGCYDEEKDEYLEVGRMSTGLTDEQFEEVTEKLKPLIINEDGRKVDVRPEVIVEAEYEEIQESPEYSSGYALRFPRMKQFREDKDEADSLSKIKNLYNNQ